MTSDAKEEMRKQRALDCRAIRMFIAAHPGCSDRDIQSIKTTSPSSELLSRMEAMEIIIQKPRNGRSAIFGWYVVPQ